MKRTTSSALCEPSRSSKNGGGIQTRAVRQKLLDDAAQEEAERIRLAQGKLRAERLTRTPLLQALPLIFKSGFLYKHEVLTAVCKTKDWEEIWTEVEDELPETALVEVVCPRRAGLPLWVLKRRGLDHDLQSQAFARQVLEKVGELKVAAKRTVRERAKARAALPKWGVDYHGVSVGVWGPNAYNDGGVSLRLVRHTLKREMKWFDSVPRFLIRLHSNLTLWTAGIRNLDAYDGTPLWHSSEQRCNCPHCRFLSFFLGVIIYESDSAADEIEEEDSAMNDLDVARQEGE